jgi:hypothetical protein
MTRLLQIGGISLLVFVFFEILFSFVPGGDAFWIFTFWMMLFSYGIASLCQILMFEPPTSDTTSSSSDRAAASTTSG